MDLLLFILIFFGFFLTGHLLSQALKLAYEDSAEAFLFCTALGSVATSIAFTLFTFAGLLYTATAWIFLAAVFLTGVKGVAPAFAALADRWRSFRAGFRMGFRESIRRGFPAFNLCVLGLLIFLSLTLALAPAYRTDALVYHLAVPKAFLAAHGLVNLPDNIYSFLPQQVEMLFLFALSLGGSDAAAQAVGWGLALLLLFALALYCRKNLTGPYAAFVPVLYFSTPTFFLISPAAYVDVAAAAYVFLAYYAWELWRTRKQKGWFFLMSVFAASAVATKLTTVIVLPLLFLGIAWEGQRQKENPLARLAAFVLITLIMLIPWWGRNVWYTGNPLAPYFLQFFGGADRFNWDPERSLLQHLHYSSFGMGRGIVDFLLLPFRLTFSSEPDSLRFDGQIGILFFLLIPAWLGLVKKRNFFPMIAVLTVLMIFWFIHFQYIRLLAPAFAFLAVLSVAGLQSFTSHHSTGVVATPGRSFIRNKLVPAALACGIVFNLTLIVKEWNRIQPVPYLTRQETRDAFLARNIPAYPLYQSVNRNLGPRDRVLFVYMRNLGYLSDRPFISDTFFEAHTLQTMLKEDASADGLSTQMKARGITHLLFNNRYVFGSDSAFSPTEKEALKEFLNGRAKLVEGRNGFYLYRFDS